MKNSGKDLPPCRQPEYLRAYRKTRYKKKREQLLAYQREWQRNHRDKMKAYDTRWREANPEAAKESDQKKHKKWYDSNYHCRPELKIQAVSRAKAWIKANPERAKQNRDNVGHRRRARIHNTQIGPVDYDKIILESNGLCGICSQQLDSKLEFDHIIPIVRGGGHAQENLQLTHATCNRRKNRRLQEEMDQ